MSTKTASVRFIFATIFLDALGIGLLIPVLPDVIRRFNSDPQFVSDHFGYFVAVYALMQFLASPVLGSLSDRFGRRPILLISLLGAGLDYILMAFAPNLTILYLGRIISGLTGASMTVASSYMADISDDKNRSANFGLIGAGWGLGFICGPLIGGLLGDMSPTMPFLGAAVLNLLNFFFGLFVLPESLPATMRRNVEIKRLNPFKSLAKVLQPSPILVLVWIYVLLFLSGQSHPSIWTLYTEYKFGWTPRQVGFSLAFVGAVIAAAQGGLTRVIIPKTGEIRALFLGIMMYVIGFALFGLAPAGWMMYAIMLLFSISGIAMPSLQSMLAKRFPSQEQGELQGTLVSLASLTAIIGPLFYTKVFSYFTDEKAPIHFPGAPYIGASLFAVVALVLYAVALHRSESEPPTNS
nr:Tetracycline_Resistance_MFS_Efflux_Pump [uncultured bacterium]